MAAVDLQTGTMFLVDEGRTPGSETRALVAVSYQGRHVGWQRVDMVVDSAVIVENKATEKLSPAARPQLISLIRARSSNS
jgi:GxxExxY protein